MLVQEYAPEGDLSVLLRSNHFRPTMDVLLEIFWQIVNAMICLADNQIIHGDLACRNVLVFRSSSTQPSEILVKLTDFGLTRASPIFSVTDLPASSTMPLIPIRSAAPEILSDTSSSSYSEKSDVYSFGVLMWEACSGGATPYGDIESTKIVYKERLKGKFLERPAACSNEFWDIILNCTQQESHRRPNFKTIEEYILTLRFQNRRESVNRISQV
jgi:serine/threonine protein kinase